MAKTILITGATAGIGRATAKYFSEQGERLILCGRRAERLDELFNELGGEEKVYTLRFDVRSRDEVMAAIDGLPGDWKDIDILINNAGNAHGLDPIDQGSYKDWDAMIDINVKGLLYVSEQVIPFMINQGHGHIVNVGSTAGKEVYPKGNVYCASKHAVDAISQGMRMDLLDKGIKVSQVNPGLVNTEFSSVRFKGDQEKADSVYQGMQPLLANDIAEIIGFITSRPAHVNVADLIVMPTDQASSTQVRRN